MNDTSKRIIVIQGPTASGKTSIAVQLAKHFNTVVLSADSRQFYKEMTIGTAKPTSDEMQGIKHYFINSHSIHDEVSAFRYAEEAKELLKILFKKHSIVILAGGSGLFIEALCKGLDPIPHDQDLHGKIVNEFNENGIESLLIELKDKDPEFYNKVDKNNSYRVIRSIEAIRLSGKTMTALRNVKKNKEELFNTICFTLHPERKYLYGRINKRVDLMLENGLLNEVNELYKYKNLKPLNTVGYKEIFKHKDGGISFGNAVDKIKQHSRNYAKRQLTWFVNRTDSIVLSFDENEQEKNLIKKIIKHIES